MGHRKKNAPRRGSLAFLPRGRAASHVGKIGHWPMYEGDDPALLGFAGFKAGMSQVHMIEDYERSPLFKSELTRAVTVLETPPALMCGVRAYRRTGNGLDAATEAWMSKPPKELGRLLVLPEKLDNEDALAKMGDALSDIQEFRAILCINPRGTSMPQKKPELMEVKVDGGSKKAQFDFARSKLGQQIKCTDVFHEGQTVDVFGVTKGKGFQGPVKRWGVKKLIHKSRKRVRGVGTLGPWIPHYVMYTVPRAGQMGFHQRTEKNKRILKMGSDGGEVTLPGGFPRYGIIRGDYIVLSGSTPGPAKRLLKLRYAGVESKRAIQTAPQITRIGTGKRAA